MSLVKYSVGFLLLSGMLIGCASGQKAQRKEMRDKAMQTSKLYCEFINGEIYSDVDVALNIEMSKRCDSDKHYSITGYKTPSENQGVIYCCTVKEVGQAMINGEKEDNKTPAEAKPEKKK